MLLYRDKHIALPHRPRDIGAPMTLLFNSHSPNNISSSKRVCIANMSRILPFVALSALASASVLQQPLQQVSESQALINSKPTISSEKLQDLIKTENLKERSKELYKIAELSMDEYNHPTRVIGSPGKLQSALRPTFRARMLIAVAQDILALSITSIPLSQN